VLASVWTTGVTAQSPSDLRSYAEAAMLTGGRGPSETMGDVAKRLAAVSPPPGFDTLHAELVGRANTWAVAEERYIDRVGGTVMSCRLSLDADPCGTDQTRASEPAQRYRREVSQAINRFSRTTAAIRKRLEAAGITFTTY
jgi:hypothetical protein